MSSDVKRLLIVIRWPVGGIRTFMRYVYRNFDAERYHLTILGPDIPELTVMARDLEGLSVDLIRLSERPSSWELFLAVAKLLVRGKYNLIHSQGFTSGVCAALPSFLLRVPHLLTSHDVLSAAQFKGLSGKVKKAAMGFVLSLVNTVHSVSEDAQQNLLEFYPFLRKKQGACVVIRNGIESSRFVTAVQRDLRKELGLDSDAFVIGFLGRFMAQKGFMYLVDAMDLLRQSGRLQKKPVVVAFGEGGYVREERAALAERGLDDSFIFLPFTPNVAGVIKGLDLVAMPSLWEACPLLPMEVLACGTPIVATDCIGLREVVRDTPALSIPSRNSKALADAIMDCMNHDCRDAFITFSHVAATRFDVKDRAKEIEALVNTLA